MNNDWNAVALVGKRIEERLIGMRVGPGENPNIARLARDEAIDEAIVVLREEVGRYYWGKVEADPLFREGMERGLEDFKAGRVVPFKHIVDREGEREL